MSRATLNYTSPGTGSPLGVEDLSGTGAGPFWPTNQIGGASAAELAAVKNGAPNSSAYGLVVRPLLYDANGVAIAVDSSGRLPVGAIDASATGNITAADANNAAPTQGGIALLNAAPTAGSFVAFNVAGLASAEVIITGTFTGTYYIEGSMDSTNGSDGIWAALTFADRSPNPAQSYFLNTAGQRRHGNVATQKWVRLRAAAAVTGTCVVAWRGAMPPETVEQVAPLPNGSNTLGSVAITNAAAVVKNSLFAVPVYTNYIQLLTYKVSARFAAGALTANTAKAILSIDHAATATKTKRVRRIIISGVNSAAVSGELGLQWQRNTAQNTAGTAVTPATVRRTQTAAEATCRSLPTAGTAGTAQFMAITGFGATAAGFNSVVVYDWQEAGETNAMTLDPGVIDGFLFSLISNAALNITGVIEITFTEE